MAKRKTKKKSKEAREKQPKRIEDMTQTEINQKEADHINDQEKALSDTAKMIE